MHISLYHGLVSLVISLYLHYLIVHIVISILYVANCFLHLAISLCNNNYFFEKMRVVLVKTLIFFVNNSDFLFSMQDFLYNILRFLCKNLVIFTLLRLSRFLQIIYQQNLMQNEDSLP